MSSEVPRQPLPFEPAKNRKKQGKKSSTPPIRKTTDEPNSQTTGQSTGSVNQKRSRSSGGKNAIPDVVSRRMVSRMVLLSGVPLLLALSTFVGSYYIITNELFILPNQAVLLVSMGCFGLSVVGLSYGIFSASWDEDRKGSLVGWQEFTINFQRMREAWRSAKSK